jgi:hypothetical protein
LEEGWKQTPVPVLQWDFVHHKFQGETTRPLCDILTPEVLTRYQKKGRYNTFLVFHSGKVIMSGMFMECMRRHYYDFMDLMREWEPEIREKITPVVVTSKAS